jgi:hypothetical protein
VFITNTIVALQIPLTSNRDIFRNRTKPRKLFDKRNFTVIASKEILASLYHICVDFNTSHYLLRTGIKQKIPYDICPVGSGDKLLGYSTDKI